MKLPDQLELNIVFEDLYFSGALQSVSQASQLLERLVERQGLAALPGGGSHWGEALEVAEEMQRLGQLAPRDLWMIGDLRRRAAAEREQR